MTDSSSGGNGGSSLARYNIGNMGVIVLERGIGNGGGGGGRWGWPHGSGHPP